MTANSNRPASNGRQPADSPSSSSSSDEDNLEHEDGQLALSGLVELQDEAALLAEYAELESTVDEIDNFLNNLAQSTMDLKRDAAQLLDEIRAEKRAGIDAVVPSGDCGVDSTTNLIASGSSGSGGEHTTAPDDDAMGQ